MEQNIEKNNFNISYKVKYILFRDEKSNFTIFTANKLVFENEKDNRLKESEVIVKGSFPTINNGDYFKGEVYWINDKKYGLQLNSVYSIPTTPPNVQGIKKFLCKKIKSVGPSTAEIIVNAYGLETFDKIKEGPEQLSKLKGIGKKKADLIYEDIINYANIEKLTLFLFKQGINDFDSILTIYDKYGDFAIPLIQSNPYNLCEDVSVKTFKIADTIASKNWKEELAVSRAEVIIKLALSAYCFSNGHMFMYESDLASKCLEFIKRNCELNIPIDKDVLNKALNNLISYEFIKNSCNENGESIIALNSFYKTEEYISESVLSLLGTNNSLKKVIEPKIKQFVHFFERENNTVLAEKQIEAIYNAAINNLSILCGGPGTGKTFTTNVIIKFFQYLNPKADILLAAPTGRAAKRMSELTHMPASTIHHLLGLQGQSDVDFELEPLEGDYLFIDEFSMVDSFLFKKILQAVEKTNIKIVLIGDYNQLPSVGPGLVLKDLINSGKVPTVILTELFRQAEHSQIAQNSKKMLNGLKISDKNGLTFDVSKQDCLFIRQNDSEGILRKIIQSVLYLSENTFNSQNIIVLTSLHKGILGDINLNNVLQQALNPEKTDKQEYKCGNYTFREGDKVMQIKNNYDLNVFNGETGVIKRIIKSNNEFFISVTYPSYPKDLNVVYSEENIDEIVLAYAMTIHKAQGSEYPCVLMPINESMVNLDVNLLYTAFTRAKSMYCAIGSCNFFDIALSRKKAITRNTNLKKLLIKS